jgi:hypothetical protein
MASDVQRQATLFKFQQHIATEEKTVRNVVIVNLKHHRMQLPREVIVGNGVIDKVSEITRRLGFSRSALIVAGSNTNNIAGKYVRELLEKDGMSVDTLLVESATVKDVQCVEDKIRVLKPEIVFGNPVHQCSNNGFS